MRQAYSEVDVFNILRTLKSHYTVDAGLDGGRVDSCQDRVLDDRIKLIVAHKSI